MNALGPTLQHVKTIFDGMPDRDVEWHAARRQELALLCAIIGSQYRAPQEAMNEAEAILKLSYERYYGK